MKKVTIIAEFHFMKRRLKTFRMFTASLERVSERFLWEYLETSRYSSSSTIQTICEVGGGIATVVNS